MVGNQMNFTEYEDLLLAKLDAEKELKMTIDKTVRNIKAGDIISLSYYRQVVTKYMGWKPLSMKDYVLKLKNQHSLRQAAVELQRKKDNAYVKRAYKLTPPNKKD